MAKKIVKLVVNGPTQEYALGHIIANYLRQGAEVHIRVDGDGGSLIPNWRTKRLSDDVTVVDLGRKHF